MSDALSELLALLSPDPENAWSEYLLLRAKLKVFFRARGDGDPDDGADEVIARVAAKLAAGVRLDPGGIGPYALGVARNVLRERWKSGSKEAELRPEMLVDPGTRTEQSVLLNECLAFLKPADRRLFLRYHLEDRVALAEEMGISLNALRIRVCRITEDFRSRYHRKRRGI